MEHAFWQERWREKRIAFHEHAPNDRLIDHFATLDLAPGATIFVPLCGKALDLDWLLERGLQVRGAELNEGAVLEVFERLDFTPEITKLGALKRCSAGTLTVYIGDFFELGADELGPIDAVYDRAALVAMPETMRADYANHVLEVTGGAKQLLVTYDYDQSAMNGPPFSVPIAKIESYYANRFTITTLYDAPIGGQLAQRVQGQEQVRLLERL